VLGLLSDAGLSGATNAELTAQGFSAEMIPSLVLSGRTVATADVEKAGDRPIKIVRMRITDAGRRAIEGSARETSKKRTCS
jgi:hypothetical protein